MGSKRSRRAKVITRSITKRKRGRPSKDTADFRVQSIADNWDFKKSVKEFLLTISYIFIFFLEIMLT